MNFHALGLVLLPGANDSSLMSGWQKLKNCGTWKFGHWLVSRKAPKVLRFRPTNASFAYVAYLAYELPDSESLLLLFKATDTWH